MITATIIALNKIVVISQSHERGKGNKFGKNIHMNCKMKHSQNKENPILNRFAIN